MGTQRKEPRRLPSATRTTCLCVSDMILGSQIVSLDSEKKAPRPWPTTCYHEELLQVLDDINLEDRSNSWDVGEGIFQDIQCVEPFLSAHQHHLQEQKSTGERKHNHVPTTTPKSSKSKSPFSRDCGGLRPVPKERRYLVAEGQRAVHVQAVITFQFQQGVSKQLLYILEPKRKEKKEKRKKKKKTQLA